MKQVPAPAVLYQNVLNSWKIRYYSYFCNQKLARLPEMLYLCKVVTLSRLRDQRKEKGITAPAVRLNTARRQIKRRPPLDLTAGAVL